LRLERELELELELGAGAGAGAISLSYFYHEAVPITLIFVNLSGRLITGHAQVRMSGALPGFS